jgi:hypothetical protein
LLDRGLHYYGIGEVKRAAELWLELLRQDPGHREAAKYLDYLKDQRPEIFAELAPRPTTPYRQPPTASRLDWANNVPMTLPTPARPASKPGPQSLAPPVGDPFDLLSPGTQPPPKSPLLDGALDLFNLNDFEGALELLNKADRQGVVDPRLHPTRAQCEVQLLKLYETRLGDQQKTPKVKVASGELVWLNLDNRAGFVLSMVDGFVTYDELFALSGMTRLDTARVLAQLVRDGVIGTG